LAASRKTNAVSWRAGSAKCWPTSATTKSKAACVSRSRRCAPSSRSTATEVQAETKKPANWRASFCLKLASGRLFHVARQLRVAAHHIEGSGQYLFAGGISLTEDGAKVLVSDLGEMCTVLGLDTQQSGIGVQSFALAHCHVFGDGVEHAIHGQHRAAVVAQCTTGVTTVGAGGHAEGGVARGTVGGGSQNVRCKTALTFEQHVAPAAAIAAGRVGKCPSAGHAQQAEDQ